MICKMEKKSSIESKRGNVGLPNSIFFFNQSKSSWFEKKGKETKLRHLQQWVEDILAGKVELKEPANSTETAPDGKQEETIKKEEL